MISRITHKRSIRGNPKCRGCGADIRKLFRKGMVVYIKTTGKTCFYCYNCKNDQYGGVRLRAKYESG